MSPLDLVLVKVEESVCVHQEARACEMVEAERINNQQKARQKAGERRKEKKELSLSSHD
jgi:hypothetical protein